MRSNSATLLKSLKVAIAKDKQGVGIIGGACPSTLGVESGGSSDPYNIETQPSSSVLCKVLIWKKDQ